MSIFVTFSPRWHFPRKNVWYSTIKHKRTHYSTWMIEWDMKKRKLLFHVMNNIKYIIDCWSHSSEIRNPLVTTHTHTLKKWEEERSCNITIVFLSVIWWYNTIIYCLWRLMIFLHWQVEIKNLNAFSAVSRAIDYEISRQVLLHSQGQDKEIVQETRLWEEGAQVTLPFLFILSI